MEAWIISLIILVVVIIGMFLAVWLEKRHGWKTEIIIMILGLLAIASGVTSIALTAVKMIEKNKPDSVVMSLMESSSNVQKAKIKLVSNSIESDDIINYFQWISIKDQVVSLRRDLDAFEKIIQAEMQP